MTNPHSLPTSKSNEPPETRRSDTIDGVQVSDPPGSDSIKSNQRLGHSSSQTSIESNNIAAPLRKPSD